MPFGKNGDVLGGCLASIAAQTLRDPHVIMVDDGSTDGGAAVAREWAGAGARFTLIQIPNGGPGRARNRGVEHARYPDAHRTFAAAYCPPDDGKAGSSVCGGCSPASGGTAGRVSP